MLEYNIFARPPRAKGFNFALAKEHLEKMLKYQAVARFLKHPHPARWRKCTYPISNDARPLRSHDDSFMNSL